VAGVYFLLFGKAFWQNIWKSGQAVGMVITHYTLPAIKAEKQTKVKDN
jgi:hypothetical protein